MSARPGRRAEAWALVLLCGVELMLILDFSIVNVALPAIGGQFGLSPSGLQWVASSYGLTLGGLLLLGGRLSDLLGRRRLFVAGLAVFSAASLAGGLAVSGLMLIIMRAVQGIGAAMAAPALLSLVTATFAEGPRRDRALGWFGAAGAIAIAAAFRLFPGTPGRSPDGGYDVPGGLTVTAGLLTVVYGLIRVSEPGPAAAAVIPLACGVLMLAGFAWLESRASSPLMPLRVFRLRALSAANGVAVLASMMVGASILMLSLQFQDVDGFSPLAAGLAFLPLGVLVGTVAATAPRLAASLGLKPVLVAGTAVMTLGTLLLARVTADSSYTGVILPGMIVLAAGFGAFISTATIAATSSVGDREQGLAAGLLNSAQQVGGTLGIALLVTLAGEHARSLGDVGKAAQASGYAYGFLAASAVGLAATVFAAFTMPGRTCAADLASDRPQGSQ